MNMVRKRLDKHLAEKYSEISRSRLQKLIKTGGVLVNGVSVKASYTVNDTDDVFVPELVDKSVTIVSEKIDLDIIKKTDDYLVVNKPAGMVVHPSETGHNTGTVVNAVLDMVDPGVGEEKRPGIVHRLDKETSGVLLVARTQEAYEHFVKQFKERKIKKVYKALVFGSPEHPHGVIEAPIARDLKNRKKMGIASEKRGRIAVSEYEVVESYEIDPKLTVSLLDVDIKTGRTHQIRVHMSSIEHPVVMDTSYGNSSLNRQFKKRFGLDRQFLHAEKLSFVDLNGKRVSVKAKMPIALQDVLEKL